MLPFEVIQPDDVKSACKEAAGDPKNEFKAGGIDLLDRFKERKEKATGLVDLLGLRGDLGRIDAGADGKTSIGALCSLATVARAEELAHPALAALREATLATATPQIRNRATVGGNLLQKSRCWYLRSAAFHCLHDGEGLMCLARVGENRYHSVMGYADCMRVHPSNLAPALIVLDAEVAIQSGDGERRIKLRQLYPDVPTAANPEHTLARGELLLRVHLPAPEPGAASSYCDSREKLSYDWATTAAAVWVRIAAGKITAARICLGAVAPNPMPVPAAESVLVGQPPSAQLFQEAATAAYAGAQPLTQNAYKVQVGKAVLIRALERATATR
jgi:xanthine dehydrogenase YagS FAD-binding subunit